MSLRCRLGFHALIVLYSRGWYVRMRCANCGQTGWMPRRAAGEGDT